MYQEEFMKAALAEARACATAGEVPVGAVIVKDGQIIARGQNYRERRQDAIAHAETEAIAGACRALHNWRLSGCDLYVTLEPCPMCAGAIYMARMDHVYFGAYDAENGAYSRGLMEVFDKNCPLFGGLCETECSALLQDFFAKKRLTK